MEKNALRAPGIRTRLALLVLASATPAVLLVAALLGYDHRRDRETLERDSMATARAMASAIDRELISLTTAAQILANTQRARSGDVAAFYPQALEVVSLKIGANVVLSDASGRQLMNTLRKPGEALPAHGNPQLVREVVRSARPVVSDLYVGGLLRRPLMSVDVPVMREGRVAYVLSIGELPERFLVLLGQQKLPPGWIGVVLDRSGTIVARTHEHERFVGTKAAPELLGRLAHSPEGAIEATSVEGIPVVSAYSRSPQTGWTVAIGIPRGAIAAGASQRTSVVGIAALAILALGLAFAWGIGGSIARSIGGLVEPAGQVGKRERVEVPPLGLREADEVGRALMRASELISSAEHRAQHDVLTGLANRALFLEIATRQVEICKRAGTQLAVLFVDIDGFKRVNDLHGHEAGDRLLCAIAGRLQNAVRGSDIAARLGGDEFAVLLVDADAAAGAAVAAKLVDALAVAYPLGALQLAVSASIGVAVFPQAGASADELLRRADEAMYRAKLAGKRRHAVA